MILNVDGYKMIFFLENLLREYINLYSEKEDLSDVLYNRIKQIASDSGETQVDNFEILLRYAHLGELVDVIKSKKFKCKKYNTVEKVNISILIKHRNDIMHSRSIKPDEMEQITRICNAFFNLLDDSTLQTKWNSFLVNDINDFVIPRVFIEYPVGKNFDRLIGRNTELRELKKEIKMPIPVSIVGHGGLGKTALVLQLIEDYMYSPEQPFDKLYFMSFKNTVFENGSIRRFEKAISNHNDLIYRLASCMDIQTVEKEFSEVEELVWGNMFSAKSLLILDNLETEIVKSNLNEFTDIAQRFISNFTTSSRLIITSRYGLGDREAKLPLHQFNIEKTADLIKSYLGEDVLSEKKINKVDWEWIQSYTSGNPGLIINFCNTLKSTRKSLLDLRVEFDTKYTSESIVLHEQLEEFLIFCFENTIESMTLESQMFLSAICYICSETNISEINEEFLIYLREELGLKKLGEQNLISQIFRNVGFLQPISSSDKFYVNELYIVYLDGNYSEHIFNVFKLKELEWYSELEKLKNHINEIQFNEELSIGRVLSELYLSRYKNKRDKKYLIRAFFCEPTLDKLVKIYNSSTDIEVINHFKLLEKVQQQLKDQREKDNQEKISQLIIRALLSINKKILDRVIYNIKQRDLLKYYQQLEKNIPLLKSGYVNLSIKKEACQFLTILKEYKKAEDITDGEPKLIRQRFMIFVKQVGDLAGKDRTECLIYIDKCKHILKNYPTYIDSSLRAKYELYSSRYFKRENPLEALRLLDNYEEHFNSQDINMFVFSLESLLIRIECLLNTNGEIKTIIILKERYIKYCKMPLYSNIFKSKRDSIEEHYNKLKWEIKRVEKGITK